MSGSTLHYVYDPLCGWCYAAGPLIEAVAGAGIPIKLHGGGLWDTAQRIAPEKCAYIRQADARIAELAGVVFGTAYLDGLLADPSTTLWSRPTTAAVLAAEAGAAGAGRRTLKAIQHAHYVDGRHVVQPPVLVELAGEIGIGVDDFAGGRDRGNGRAYRSIAAPDASRWSARFSRLPAGTRRIRVPP